MMGYEGTGRTMSKGSRREREAVELWQRAGFATYRPATVRFGENDVWGLFDVMAVSPSHDRTHAVQVKSNRATGIESWTRQTAMWRRLGYRTMYAVPVDNQGWRIIECESGVGPAARSMPVDERDVACEMGQGVVDWLRSQAV